MNHEITENKNKGFSLVELIVCVAIMAVMAAVLAPSLLAYVERSRAQKDDSAMGEVVNAVKLAMADQDIYDEMLVFNSKGNAACYTDGRSDAATLKVTKNDANEYDGVSTVKKHGDENAVDESKYRFAGNMRGVTITFTPADKVISIADGKINAAENSNLYKVNGTVTAGTATIGNSGEGNKLYYRLRSVVGEEISLASQTYRNSDYTVFIQMGTLGGTDASKQSAIEIYGQWGGTNLDDASAFVPAGT